MIVQWEPQKRDPVEFQKSIKDRNLTEDKNPKLSWRVGIHLDDIIIEGDNIYGNGVNIAARLEKSITSWRNFNFRCSKAANL